jgi:cellulose synthase/poly-beta-1,6-N-acetylglucosamine synthase-like glycosyltransferase
VKLVFWLSLLAILYTYVGYPALIWILARLRPRPVKSGNIHPTVSIVLAVHNGAGLIQEKIQHLLNLDYSPIKEVIVVSDGSTDGTAELLASILHPRLKTRTENEHRGKAAAVNAGVAEATADIILFVDIRPRIESGAIEQLVSNFADPSVGCVNGELVLRCDDHVGAPAVFSGLYWRYENWIRDCEATFDSPVGVYGGFYAVRRDLVALQPAGIILDDMFQPLSIIRKGYRVVLDRKSHVNDTWPKTTSGEFQRKVRTLAGNFQLFRLAPWTLTLQNRMVFQLISHKVMRLILPYLFVLLQVSSLLLFTHSWIYASVAVIQTLSLGLSIAALRYRIPVLDRIASPASAIMVLNCAAVVALYKFMFTRGPLWKIWNSPQVSRKTPPLESEGFQSTKSRAGTVAAE